MERQEGRRQEGRRQEFRCCRSSGDGWAVVKNSACSQSIQTARSVISPHTGFYLPTPELLTLQPLLDINDARECFNEVLKSTSRKHDGVPAPTNILRDFQKPSAFVLFEIEKEDLPINLNLLGRERFVYFVWCVGINHNLPFLRSPEKFKFLAAYC